MLNTIRVLQITKLNFLPSPFRLVPFYGYSDWIDTLPANQTSPPIGLSAERERERCEVQHLLHLSQA